MGKQKYCGSELVQLAGSFGHLNRLYVCSTEKDLREAIGDHMYNQLFQMGNSAFYDIRAFCIQKMENSVNFQRGQIGYKFNLKGRVLSSTEESELAGWCCGMVA